MVTKEQLQAIVNIIPDGFEVEIYTAGNMEQSINSVYFKYDEKKVIIQLTDELNRE